MKPLRTARPKRLIRTRKKGLERRYNLGWLYVNVDNLGLYWSLRIAVRRGRQKFICEFFYLGQSRRLPWKHKGWRYITDSGWNDYETREYVVVSRVWSYRRLHLCIAHFGPPASRRPTWKQALVGNPS